MVEDRNYASHWVSRVIDSGWPVSVGNPLLASVLRFGLLPNVFFALVLVFQPRQVPDDFLVAMFFAVVWLNVGPLLIWYYDERVLPTFFEEVSELVQNATRIDRLNEKYDTLFAEKYVLPTGLWVLLLVGLFFRAQEFLAQEGLFTVAGPFYFAYLASVVYLGILTGIGFMGVITTVLAIREISSEPLNINPLHPDGLGGLGVFGYYAIRTTLTFSTGSLLLPLAFIFVRMRGVTALIYVIVLFYMGAIALSFVYPTYKINRQAQRIRDGKLDELRREYEAAKRQMQSAGGLSTQLGGAERDGSAAGSMDSTGAIPDSKELLGQLELQRLRNEYDDYQSVRLYPFQIDILLKLVSSILLPLVFVVIDQYLDLVI